MNSQPPDIRTLYLHHKDAIYRFVWRLTGSASAAEDVLQDCFIALLRDRCNYNPDKAPARAFLLGMARNIARKRWRTEQRWALLDEENFRSEPIDPAQGEIADLVAGAIQSLPPLQREALILFEYEELSR
ncbi:MAG: RNA polymerase sigma factor [Bryobacterales bacterium]|nr:RNA polymerase sigma factor [Bryobacterales bacterium]